MAAAGETSACVVTEAGKVLAWGTTVLSYKSERVRRVTTLQAGRARVSYPASRASKATLQYSQGPKGYPANGASKATLQYFQGPKGRGVSNACSQC